MGKPKLIYEFDVKYWSYEVCKVTFNKKWTT